MAISGPQTTFAVIAVIYALSRAFSDPLQNAVAHFSLRHGFQIPYIASPPVVVIDAARGISYVGLIEDGVENFHNIFYAEDTALTRFRPPVPKVQAPGSVIDARRDGAWCPQGMGDILPFTSRVTNISEDCLSLKIARPYETRLDNALPVMVWLHGGGHALGSGSDILYDASGLVKQAAADGQPVIFVSINYRLGIFGFASSPEFRAKGWANAGLRDQRAALEWVRGNIAAFGGDPQRVTAIGQSTGASDIGLQMTAFGGERGVPFQRAIMMSGSPNTIFNMDPKDVDERTLAAASDLTCEPPTVRGHDTDDPLRCIAVAPMLNVAVLSVEAMRQARPPFGEGYFYPTIDGDFIPSRPSELVRSGQIAKGIPIMASWVENDGAWYASWNTLTDEDVLATFGRWLTELSSGTRDRLLELYPVDAFEHLVKTDSPISAQYYRAAQMNRDLWFTCPVLDFTSQYQQHGEVEAAQIRLYTHNATRYAPVLKMMGVSEWRVSHLSDIPFVLNNPHLKAGADNSAAQMLKAKQMSRAVVRFVHGAADDQWPAAFERESASGSTDAVSLLMFGVEEKGVPIKMGAVETSEDSETAKALRQQRILERCDFINRATVRREMGV